MNDILRDGFQIGNKHVRPLVGQVSGHDGSYHLTPKVMDVLVCLAERPGEVVTREDIIAAVWGSSEVADDALTHSVSELRKCFGDHSDRPEFIRTVPKRGYQLIAPVKYLGQRGTKDYGGARSLENSSIIIAMIVRLRRRRVFRAVGAYAIFAWAVLQISDVVIQPLGIPVWTMTAITWVVILGFPVTVVAAWALQITDRGIIIDSVAEPDDEANLVRLRSVDYVIVGSLLLILGVLSYQVSVLDDQPLIIESESGRVELPKIIAGPVDPSSIAVLPFLSIGVEPELDYLALGLAEEVLNLLANIGELKVASRQMSFRYQGSDTDIQTIADELRVQNILEGSVQGEDGDLRITAQLIDADSGYHVWSQTYKHGGTEILLVRDEIAKAVVDSLKVVLSVESQLRLAQAPTQSPKAYDFYLQALSYLRRPKTEQTLDNAEGLFQRALDLDPEYAKAYAGLCEVYLGKYQQRSDTEYVEPAKSTCTQALVLDPTLAEVHSALGALYRLTGKFEEAEAQFQSAIVKNPALEPAFYGLGRVYMSQNRLQEAESIFEYAVDLEPGYWGTHLALGNFYLEFGRPSDAIAPFKRVTELNPDYAMGFNNLGAAYYNSGDFENGEKAFVRSIDIGPTESAFSNLGTMYYNTGRFEEAANMYNDAIKVTPHDYTLWGRLAGANRQIVGREDEVDQNFRTAIDLAEDQIQVNPNDSRALAYVASYYASLGDSVKSRAAIQKALSIGPNDPHVFYFLAHVNILLGDNDGALAALERSAELGYSIKAIGNDPVFENLRENSRFLAILN